MLKIFNTLTKKKEKFKPILTNIVKMYVCGITVYDLCHIGHGRIFIIFDVVIRYLRYCGYQVHYARNITDIDDKIIKKNLKHGESIKKFTNCMIREMYADLDALNILRPDHEPKVTEHINTIIKLIGLLITKKHAYITSSGDVMFSISTFSNYGILSGRKITTSKVHNALDKNNKFTDFVLWKASKPNEPYWMSPWGSGRPGWHIECSAMSSAVLGHNLDIHGGGSDLIFPHHENEIAQSVCAYNMPYANIWMHVGMLSLNNAKMSKSLNNFFTIRDVLQNYDAETIRFFLMSVHYRKTLQYNNNALKKARLSLERLYISLRDTNPNTKPYGGECFISEFIDKMNDDFNIPAAYSILFEIAHKLNDLKNKKHSDVQGMAATLRYLANILGLLNQDPEIFLKSKVFKKNRNYNIKIVQKLIKIRENARDRNQWDIADKIRNKLTTMGVVLEDNSTGSTKWRLIS